VYIRTVIAIVIKNLDIKSLIIFLSLIIFKKYYLSFKIQFKSTFIFFSFF